MLGDTDSEKNLIEVVNVVHSHFIVTRMIRAKRAIWFNSVTSGDSANGNIWQMGSIGNMLGESAIDFESSANLDAQGNFFTGRILSSTNGVRIGALGTASYNVFQLTIDNVAVGGQYWGFFFDIPNMEVEMPNSDNLHNLRSLPSLEFEDNLAYNNRHGGIKVIRPTIDEEIPKLRHGAFS